MELCLREVSFNGTIIERHDDLYDEGIIIRDLDGNPREIQEQYEARATERRERDLRKYCAGANVRQYASRTYCERSMRGRDNERGLNTDESLSSEEEETNGDNTDFSFSDSDDDYDGLSTEFNIKFVINAVSVSQVLQSLVSQVNIMVDLKAVEEDLRLVVLDLFDYLNIKGRRVYLSSFIKEFIT
ncbi:hypothetical protein BD770DRAFT_416632 [Pilaira anomala]|nr:hypothetical protein BD770DRAFT_416632 [Pilaira anomala]